MRGTTTTRDELEAVSGSSVPKDRLTRFWAHAAVFGALWGAVEITLGGFLHTIKLPLCGLIMACGQAAFLVAVRQMVPVTGLAAGISLVAAGLKLLAPAGSILSPSAGILIEGLWVELALSLVPGRLVSAALAGILGVAWSLAQFIAVQLLFYGGSILAIYHHAHRALTRTFGSLVVHVGVLGALALMALAGALFGLWGARLGRRVRNLMPAHGSSIGA